MYVYFPGSPRLLPDVQTNVTAALNEPATLSVILQAYPVPSPNNCIWKKCNNFTCFVLEDETYYKIFTVGLLSNLTILNVNEEDFGQYVLNVTNELENYWVFVLNLAAQGKL